MKQNIKILIIIGLTILVFIGIGLIFMYSKTDTKIGDGSTKLPAAQIQDQGN
jgi:hypothetical protein